MKRHLILSTRVPLEIYINYYKDQQQGYGSEDRFHGVAFQRGHGFGSVFKGLWRIVRPLVRSAGKAIGKQAIRSSAELMGDIARGENVMHSFKSRAEEGGRELASTTKRKLEEIGQQHGSGKKLRSAFSIKPAALVYRPTRAKKSTKKKSTKKKPFTLKTVF